MVLDEPTAALSDHEIESLFKLLRRFREQGMGILYISHHLNEIFELADTVTVLRNGKVAGHGPIQDFTTADVIRLMIDRDLSSQYVKEPVEVGPEVLRTEGLTCRRIGIYDVSIIARAGEIVGLGGLMGSGRSELASLLFGAVRPDSGRVYVDGRGHLSRFGRPSRPAYTLFPRNGGSSGWCRWVDPLQHNPAVPEGLQPLGDSRYQAEHEPVEKLMRELRVKARRRRISGDAQRRKPAEGSGGQVAHHQVRPGIHLRRADAGNRRRGQDRGLPDDAQPCQGRRSDHPDLL